MASWSRKPAAPYFDPLLPKAVGDALAILSTVLRRAPGHVAQRSLQARGVQVHLRTCAESIGAGFVRLQSRRVLASCAVIASIGHLEGVALVLGLPLSGRPAWLLGRACDLSRMPTLRRQLRPFVERTGGPVFPSDIAQLRSEGSQALAEGEQRDHAAAAEASR